MIAVIGVITVFQGLIAVCVNETGPILYRPSLLKHSGEDCIGCRKSLIVSFWMSGSISSRFGCRVAWNIAENNGKVHCWSVPCRNSESSHWSSAEPNVSGQSCPSFSQLKCNSHIFLLFPNKGRAVLPTRTREARYYW